MTEAETNEITTEKSAALPSYDFLYLKKNINDSLTEALCKLCVEQPNDPIDFIGRYLLQIVEIEKQNKEHITLQAKYEHLSKETRVAREKNELKSKEKKDFIQAEKEAEEGYSETLMNISNMEDLYSFFFSRLTTKIQLSGAWIGRKVTNTEGGMYIVWKAASTNSKNVIDKYIFSEENTIEFDLLKEPESDEKETDPSASLSSPPTFLIVDNVLRESRMKYYSVPKIGSYGIFIVNYQSYLHNHVDELKAEPTTLLLCIHTMGQNGRQFTASEIEWTNQWFKRFGQSIEKFENDAYTKETQEFKNKEADYESNRKQILEQRTKIQESIKPTDDAIPKTPLSDLENQLKVIKLLISFYMEKLCELSSTVVPLKLSCVNIAQTTIALMGVKVDDLCNPATNAPEWRKIRPFFEPSKFSELFNGADLQKQPISDAIRQTVETTTPQDLNHPMVELLLEWSQIFIKCNDEKNKSPEVEVKP